VSNRKKIPFESHGKFADLLVAWFPAVVAFFLIPFAIYLPNQKDFAYDLTNVLPYIIFLAFSLPFLCILLLCKPRLRGRIATGLFFFGVYLALSDIVGPVLTGDMTKFTLPKSIPEPKISCIVDLILGAVFFLVALKFPIKLLRKIGPIIVLVSFFTNLGVIASSLSANSHFGEPKIETVPAPKPLAEGGNIYQIVFDGFDNTAFLDSLAVTANPSDFDGFVFFKNNFSNYLCTYVSDNSFMTGTYYEGGHLGDWLREGRKGGLIEKLFNTHYEITQYLVQWNPHQYASHIVFRRFDRSRYFRTLYFADLWLLRLMPVYLHQEICNKGKGIFTSYFVRSGPFKISDLLRERGAWSVGLMQDVIAQEKMRPDHGQYVYAHIMCPHSPFIFNADCIPDKNASYNTQLRCSVKLMVSFIKELKRQGKYRDALIIFQSDHGFGLRDKTVHPFVASSAGADETLLCGRQYRNKINSLLLVKPPGSFNTPMVISKRLTALVDIPQTIYHLKGINAKAPVSYSLFDDTVPENRNIHIFCGFQQMLSRPDARGKIMHTIRPANPVGEVRHFSYNRATGWKEHPKINVRW